MTVHTAEHPELRGTINTNLNGQVRRELTSSGKAVVVPGLSLNK